MPQYAVAADTLTRPRRATRKRRVADVQSELPTAKVPDAVAVAPSPMYNVIPQDPSGAAALGVAPAPSAPLLNAPEAPTPTIAQPIEADDPATAGLKRAAATLQTVRDAPVEKTSRLKAFLKMAAFALGQSKPGRDWADVAMQAGQALGGGVSGAVQPKLPGAVQKLYNVQKAEDELATAQKYAQTSSLVQRRSDTTRLSELSLGQRAKAAAATERWRDYNKKNIASQMGFREWRMKHGDDLFLDKQTQDALDNDFRERGLFERIRQFNINDTLKRVDGARKDRALNLRERMVAAVEAGKLSAVQAEAQKADDAADAANDAADEIQGLITELGDEIDPIDRAQLKTQVIRLRKEGKAKGGGSSVPQTIPMKTARPKNDPENLFK